jgi:hypothetical protein
MINKKDTQDKTFTKVNIMEKLLEAWNKERFKKEHNYE